MRSLSADSTDNPLDVFHRNLWRGQPDDVPTAQPRVKVFLAIADESHAAIVPATAATKNAALDFEKQAAGKVREIRAPASLGMKHELAFQSRATRCAPIECKLRFEARAARFGTKALELHAARRLSIHPPIHRPQMTRPQPV